MTLARWLRPICLVLGPLLLTVSTFFWTDGRYGPTGGTLIAIAMVPWAYGLLGEYELLRRRLPRFAELWLFYLLYGVLGGIAFGLQGFFEGAYRVSEQDSLERLSAHPIESQIVLWLSGPAFPLALLMLAGIYQCVRGMPERPSSLAIGILGLAAVMFPLSRIPRVEWLAHLSDALLVVAFGLLAWQRLTRRDAAISRRFSALVSHGDEGI